jgi:phage major head subunit gpT-like protein
MDLNTANLQILTTGVQAIYQNAFNAYAPEVIYQRLCTENTSTTSEEIYPWLGQSTGFREWAGDRVMQNLSVHSYAIKNKKFENSVSIPRDAVEDDRYGVFNPMFAQLGKDASEHPDVLTFQALQNAGTLLCYDGLPFFSNAHPGKTAAKRNTTYSNDMGGAGATWYLLCTKQVIKPLMYQKRRPYNFTALVDLKDPNVFKRDEFDFGVDGRSNVGFGLWQTAIRSQQPLTAANYEAARVQMMSFLRDNGQPWNLVPDTLLVGPSNEGAAKTIIEGQTIVVLAGDGGAAPSNIWKGTAEVLMTPRITW